MEKNKKLTKEELLAVNGGYGFIGETFCPSCGSNNVDLTGGIQTGSGDYIGWYECLDCGDDFLIRERD